MSRIYKILQFLSVDIVLGSIGSSVLAVKVLSTHLPNAYWYALPISVWIIYAFDHLIDALKVGEDTKTEKYTFHYLHWKSICAGVFLAIMLLFTIIIKNLNTKTIEYGLILSFLIFVYILINLFLNSIFKFFPRELIIAIGYIAGTWGIPLMQKYPFIYNEHLIFIINYFFLVLSIPILYSFFEYKYDKYDGIISYSTTFGVKMARFTFQFLIMLSFILSVITLFLFQENTSIIMIWMAISLYIVFFYRKQLSHNAKYKLISDSIFFLPLLLLINV